MEMEKKKAAALAAVTMYIKSEEEAVAAARLPECAPARNEAIHHYSPWGSGGRMQQMQMRHYMQMKAFHRP